MLPPDRFESEHMPPNGRLLRREKYVNRYHWVMLVLAGVFAVLGGGLLVGGSLPGALAFAAPGPALLMGALWVLFSVVRIHLTDRELSVQLGPFGPRVPLEAIEACRVIPRPRGTFRSGGARLDPDGRWSYSFMMSAERADLVEVLYESGRRGGRVVLTSDDPAALVRAIEAARAKLGSGPPVRVADGPPAAGEPGPEAALSPEDRAADGSPASSSARR